MKDFVFGFVVAVAFVGFVAHPSTARPPSISAGGSAALSEFLRANVARGDAPAIAALVVNRDGVIFESAAGTRGRREQQSAGERRDIPNRVDDQAGHVARRHDAARRPITIRHLLTHTSGIVYTFANPRLAKIDDGKKTEAEMPLLHDPGERFTYGPNTAVLGQIVEKISGQTLDVFLQQRIFDPLGMHDTFFIVPPDKIGRLVTLHLKMNGALNELPNPAAPRSAVRGDGGLFSDARDYGRFMQMWLNGGRFGRARLVKESTVKEMISNQIGRVVVETQAASGGARSKPFPLGAGKDKFGFGFQLETAPSERGLRSPGSYSWGGINNTHFWIDPQRQIAGVVLMQVLPYYDESCIDVLRGFERLVYQQIR